MINYSEFKKFFLYNMVGSLIVCALVAVVSVLIAEFTQTLGRVVGTLFMLVIHSLISLAFIWDNEKQGTFNRLSFFINVLFMLIILSFLTSIFAIWDVAGMASHVGDMYQFFFIIAFAALHGNILYKASGKESYIDMVIVMNYIFMALVVLMLMPIIFMENISRLPDIFFRILGAGAIIDGTLSILTIIFYRLHTHKYPKEESPLENNWGNGEEQVTQSKRKGGLSIWVWILLIYLVIQIGFPILGFFFFSGW